MVRKYGHCNSVLFLYISNEQLESEILESTIFSSFRKTDPEMSTE